jgi:hypothetical protein
MSVIKRAGLVPFRDTSPVNGPVAEDATVVVLLDCPSPPSHQLDHAERLPTSCDAPFMGAVNEYTEPLRVRVNGRTLLAAYDRRSWLSSSSRLHTQMSPDAGGTGAPQLHDSEEYRCWASAVYVIVSV